MIATTALLLQAPMAHRGLAAPAAVGYRDFAYGTSVGAATGEKPESKLWWNDGSWWGCLWDPGASAYTIQRFDVGTQAWSSTGTRIDERPGSRADALWDGSHLYIASHVFAATASATTAANGGRLYRFSYSAGSRAYSLDSGFPVNVNASKSETLVLAKDSAGRLWITWVEAGRVKLNRTLGDDLTWGPPFDLPGQGADVTSDDIASVAAFDVDRIGVMWSNQADLTMYFAVHLDGQADTIWQPREDALADAKLGQLADDHINLKIACDGTGDIYAVTKTGLSGGSNPLIYVLRRQSTGQWSRHVFATYAEQHTRPILCIDADDRRAYVFAQSDDTGRQIIYMKSASLSDLAFPSGLGTPFIDRVDDPALNNPTTTKQCVGRATGLLVLASARTANHYLHNYLRLGATVPPSITAFTPASGPAGTQVTIAGSGFVATDAVTFGGVSASFVVDGDAQIRATVPAGADTGRIGVSNPAGSAESAADFDVTLPPTTLVFHPTHDSYVKSGEPNRNFGLVKTLLTQGGATLHWSYLKFDVTGATTPVLSARLRLWVTDGSDQGGAAHAVSNDYRGTATPWTETGITWNNAPPLGAAAMDSLGPVKSHTWVELDVLPAITGNGTYSFAVRTSSTNNVKFTSGETPTPPELVVTIPTTPPATDARYNTAAVPRTVDAPSLELRQNQPNPFRVTTAIAFRLPAAAPVRLAVYDLGGRVVRCLVDDRLDPGTHVVQWNGRDGAGLTVPCGVYFVRLATPNATALSRKILFVR